jgi:hypothetical protein
MKHSTKLFVLTILASSCLTSVAFAQNNEASTAQGSDEKKLTAIEKILPEVIEKKSEQTPDVTYSPLLPAKIHPRQTSADGLSIAAANVQTEEPISADHETIGLIETASQGALPTNTWQGYARATLASALLNPAVQSPSPTFNHLLRRALISKLDVATLSTDVPPVTDSATPPAPAANLFETRMQKLLDMGLYRDAFDMYRKLGDAGATQSSTAKLGVLSMIGSGQLGTACLENRVIPSDKKLMTDQDLWKELNQFCDALLSPASAQDKNEYDALARASRSYSELNVLKTVGSTETLQQLSPINLIALYRSGRLGKGVVTPATMATMNSHILAALHAVTPPRSDDSYNMMSQLIARGLKTPADLVAQYKNHTQTLRKQSQAQGRDLGKGKKDKESAWTNMALIYTDLISADQSAPPATLLKNAITTSSTISKYSLLPFARHFTELESLKGFTKDEAKIALWVLLKANLSPSKEWVSLAYPVESKAISAISGESLLLKIILKDVGTPQTAISSTEKAPMETTVPAPAEPIVNTGKSLVLLEQEMLAAYLAGEPNVIKSAKLAYENNFSLTGNSNYVMHSEELRNSLQSHVASGNVGGTILTAILAAGNAQVTSWSPPQFSVTIDSLYSVGLGDDVRSLIRERMAGLL